MTIDNIIQKLDAFINNKPASFSLDTGMQIVRQPSGIFLLFDQEPIRIDMGDPSEGLTSTSTAKNLENSIKAIQPYESRIEEQYIGLRLTKEHALHTNRYFTQVHGPDKPWLASDELKTTHGNLLRLHLPLKEQVEEFEQAYQHLQGIDNLQHKDTASSKYRQLKKEIDAYTSSLWSK